MPESKAKTELNSVATMTRFLVTPLEILTCKMHVPNSFTTATKHTFFVDCPVVLYNNFG